MEPYKNQKNMKKTLTVLMSAAILCGCQDYLTPLSDLKRQESQFVSTKSEGVCFYTAQIDTPVTFLADTNFTAWASIVGLENRFKECDIPESRACAMTTEALVKSIIKYPLNYLISAYNNPEDAINLFIDRSTIHKELIKREDSVNMILQCFTEMSWEMNEQKQQRTTVTADKTKYTDGLAFEYLFGSGLFSSDNTIQREKLRSAVLEKLCERKEKRDTFSFYSINPLFLINKRMDLGIAAEEFFNDAESDPEIENLLTWYPVLIGSQTISTVFNKQLVGLIIDELSNTEIINLTNEFVSNYPNAVLRGSSTSKYNCHSFAWYNSSVNNTIWLNAQNAGTLQLSKYWTQDLYENCSSSVGEKAYYANGDHSANILDSGKYLSKWGAGPLMEHDYNDCPYTTTGIQFYRIRTSPLINVYSFYGPSSLSLDAMGEYSATTYSQINNVWSAECVSSNSPNAIDFYNPYAGTYRLTCHEYGAYKIYIDGYYGSHRVAWGEKLIVCQP